MFFLHATKQVVGLTDYRSRQKESLFLRSSGSLSFEKNAAQHAKKKSDSDAIEMWKVVCKKWPSVIGTRCFDCCGTGVDRVYVSLSEKLILWNRWRSKSLVFPHLLCCSFSVPHQKVAAAVCTEHRVASRELKAILLTGGLLNARQISTRNRDEIEQRKAACVCQR